MKSSISLLFIMMLSRLLSAQTSPYQIGSDLLSSNRYLKAFDTVARMKNTFILRQTGHQRLPTEFDQALSFFASAIGEQYMVRWSLRNGKKLWEKAN